MNKPGYTHAGYPIVWMRCALKELSKTTDGWHAMSETDKRSLAHAVCMHRLSSSTGQVAVKPAESNVMSFNVGPLKIEVTSDQYGFPTTIGGKRSYPSDIKNVLRLVREALIRSEVSDKPIEKIDQLHDAVVKADKAFLEFAENFEQRIIAKETV